MTLDEALRITTRATKLAGARSVSMAVAVVDAGGHLVTLHRKDGVPFIAAGSPGARRGPPPPGVSPPKSRAPRLPGFRSSPPRSSWPAAAGTRPRPGAYPSGEAGR